MDDLKGWLDAAGCTPQAFVDRLAAVRSDRVGERHQGILDLVQRRRDPYDDGTVATRSKSVSCLEEGARSTGCGTAHKVDPFPPENLPLKFRCTRTGRCLGRGHHVRTVAGRRGPRHPVSTVLGAFALGVMSLISTSLIEEVGNVFVMAGVAAAGTSPLVLLSATWEEVPV